MQNFQGEFFKVSVLSEHPLQEAVDGRNEILDGDTLVIGGERWRLCDVDAPELNGHCETERQLASAAKEYLETLIKWGAEKGKLEFDILGHTDKFRRRLVRIRACGLDVGQLLIEHGLAKPYSGKGPKPIFCSCQSRVALHEAQVVLADERKARRHAAR